MSDVSTTPHGTYARYVSGCHCDSCRAANRDYKRSHRKRGRDNWVRENYGDCVAGLGWPRYPGQPAP